MPSSPDTSWRLIIDGPGNAAWNMSVDEALAVSARKKGRPPVLRLYDWAGPALTLGYFQKYNEEVDRGFCEKCALDVVRRLTGGRAVVHDPEEVTYSFSAPFSPHFEGQDLQQTYRNLSKAFIHGLNRLGMNAVMSTAKRPGQRPGRNPVCFQSLSFAEAAVDGRKIIGSAQKRWSNGFLQQGSIPLELNYEMLFAALRFQTEESRERSRQRACRKMAGLREFVSDLKKDDVVDAIRAGFESTFGIHFASSALTEQERSLARTLMTTRYEAPEWNGKR